MSKQETFVRIHAAYKEQAGRLIKAAQDAHAASTSEEAKAEGKYDTRGTEAAYLAGAQAEQAEHAQRALAELESFKPKDFDYDDTIALGALVETEKSGAITYYFLLPHGGGITDEHEGFDLNVLTPDAPFYQNLLGQKAGATVEQTLILGVE